MRRELKRVVLISSPVILLFFIVLAFTPHYACACVEYEDGSQVTHFINTVSETITGKPLIERKPNPFEEKK